MRSPGTFVGWRVLSRQRKACLVTCEPGHGKPYTTGCGLVVYSADCVDDPNAQPCTKCERFCHVARAFGAEVPLP